MTKEEFTEYYTHHNQKEVMEHFKISRYKIEQLSKEYNFDKNKVLTRDYKIKELSKRIPLEDIIDYYDTKNNNFEDTANHFNISVADLFSLMRLYNYHKSKESHMNNIRKIKLEKYGDENYNNSKKIKETNLKLYGVENQFQRKELFPKIYNCKVSKYGSYNNIVKNHATRIQNSGTLEESYRLGHETYVNSCMSKYGVPNTSMLESTKEKIKKSLEDTFTELYGSTCYWTTDNAKRSNGSKNSKANEEFKKLLESHNIKYTQEFKVDNRWFDFKVDGTLVEINPSATHNSTWGPFGNHEGITKTYHKEKSELALKNNLFCIHIFDWDDKEKILNRFIEKKDIRAEDCEIKDVSRLDCNEFLNKYHPQSYTSSQVRIGLYYSGELVEIMTFTKPRYNKKFEWEIARVCAKPGLHILGGCQKLLDYFKDVHKPQNIIVYCDLAKLSGKMYENLGFKLLKKALPTLHWYNPKTKQHITNSFLWSKGFDRLFGTDYGKTANNNQLMLEHGFVEIYDCGQATYIWKKSVDK